MSARKALLTSFDPDVTYIEDVFSTYLYDGNSSTQTITNGIDLAGKGGLVWMKDRSGTTVGHALVDSARSLSGFLQTHTTNAAGSNPSVVTSLNSTGFTLGSSPTANLSSATYVSWAFRKAPKFFDVVTYTGTGSAQSVAHSLGQVPGMVIVKRTDVGGSGYGWPVWHRSLTAGTGYLILETTAAATTATAKWNSTDPTTTHFTVGTASDTNTAGGTYVAYLFAHDTTTDGLIQCGSFSGNTSVTLGWEPQFVLIKNTAAGTQWLMLDTMRGLIQGNAVGDNTLFANSSAAEATGTSYAEATATGFNTNTGAGSFIYLAIRRGPMRLPTSGTQVYQAIARTGTGATVASISGLGFSPDMTITQQRTGVNRATLQSRLCGTTRYMQIPLTSIEGTGGAVASFDMDGYTISGNLGPWNGSTAPYIDWAFRRYPGVFDQVYYNGTGSNKTEAHNLAVAPELWIGKRRNSAGNWVVGSTLLANTEKLLLNSTDAKATDATAWNSTYPTASAFSLGTMADVNASGGTFGMLLFATLAGISKVFSYTGNGTSKTINCGFAAGARFILIKRTDSTDDWFIYDTVRGVVAGNDPHLSLNTTAAEVTTDDSIDPDASGFIVNQVAATNINVNGATYIGFAIA